MAKKKKHTHKWLVLHRLGEPSLADYMKPGRYRMICKNCKRRKTSDEAEAKRLEPMYFVCLDIMF